MEKLINLIYFILETSCLVHNVVETETTYMI